MKIEKEIFFKKQLNTLLNKAFSFANSFLKKYEEAESKEEINKLIFSHNIYANKKKIDTFAKIIINAGESINNNIIEIKEKSEMRKKRKNEFNKINSFLSNYNQKTIQEEKINEKKLLPKPKTLNIKKISNNNSNIISEDDILFEEQKENDKQFLQKKTKFQNNNNDNKDNNNQTKKIYYPNCYICQTKLEVNNIHKFYGNLCIKCGNYNYSFREMKLDFSRRIAVVTGGRIKIGYYIATKLLSYGCKVVTTSRFPKDTLLKYKNNPDYELWKNNLIIYPIDFRIFESTVKFINFLKENFTHIDILINNAAQTVRRTTAYYKYLLPIETKELNPEDENIIIKNDYISLKNQLNEENNLNNKEEISKSKSLISLDNNLNKELKEILPLSVIASQIKIMEEKDQPQIMLMGNDGQPYDFSAGKSSWSFEFDEIPLQEFTEVQIINAWTPYYLCAKLKPLLMKSPFNDRYIVNVTSPEGNFIKKRSFHVHTNMAKAALNMFTFTCGKYLKKDGIYMTCVDTGWITYMKEMKNILDEETNSHFENSYTNVPLDELDGAMRVLHPIIEGIKNKNYLFGILLRNYTKTNW